MQKLSITAGCVIESNFVYMSTSVDKYDYSTPFSRMFFLKLESDGPKWFAHDVQFVSPSVCAWRDSPFGKPVWVALSNQGEIEIVGSKGQPNFVEHIPGAGSNKPWSRGKGFMTRIRQIGSRIYACGSAFLTFRRDENGWHEFTDPALEDAPDVESQLGGLTIRSSQNYYDINGPDEVNIYAIGWEYSFGKNISTSIISFYNGSHWRILGRDFPSRLFAAIPSERGGIYAVGWGGTVLYGDAASGFKQAGNFADNEDFTNAAEFQGALYLVSTTGLFQLDGVGRSITPVSTNLRPTLGEVHSLQARDGVLWVFGAKELAFFDGKTWTRVPHPQTARIPLQQ